LVSFEVRDGFSMALSCNGSVVLSSSRTLTRVSNVVAFTECIHIAELLVPLDG
jgi:hypothetical protein